MQNNQFERLVQGTLILTVSAFIAKILGAIYRIPLQNLVGDTGFYVYQQVYPIYGIGMALALNGLPIYISKLVANTQDEQEKKDLVLQLTVALSLLGVLAWLVLQFGAHLIANLMGDVKLAPLIQMVSYMFLLLPFLALPRGFFQGQFQMQPTAISQVIEQVIRVGIILMAAIIAKKQSLNVYQMGTLAMTGPFIGGLLASCYLLWLTFKQFSRHFQAAFKLSSFTLSRYRLIFRKLIIEGGALCLFVALMIVFQLIDAFTVKNGLVNGGMLPQEAMALKGAYDRSQPLVQLGLVIATALSTTLVPSLTKALRQKKTAEFYLMSQNMLQISLLIASAATVGLISLIQPINQLLFGDTIASGAIVLYLISITLVTLINVAYSVLQSLNQNRKITFILLMGIFVKLLLNDWLVTKLGLKGASQGTLLGLGIICLLLVINLPKKVRQAFYRNGFWWKLIIANSIMGSCVFYSSKLWYTTVLTRFQLVGFVSLEIIMGVVLFLVTTLKIRLLTPQQLRLIPGIKHLIKHKGAS